MADSHVVWLYSKLYNVVTPTYPFVNTLLKRYERPNGQLSAGTLNPIGLNDYEGAAQQLPFAHSNDADVYIITDSYCVKTDV